jgi:hypothetical protein
MTKGEMDKEGGNEDTAVDLRKKDEPGRLKIKHAVCTT